LKKYPLLLVVFVCIQAGSYAQKLKIRLLSDLTLSRILFTPLAGDYKLRMDTCQISSENNPGVYQLTVEGDSVRVKSFEKDFGKCARVLFEAQLKEGSFKLKSIAPEIKVKVYDNDLEVRISQGGLKLINRVGIENYIAGVVESEAGSGSTSEYYKLQSILCRTYALSNIHKHEADSFNLCDLVHCQSYKGKSENTIILQAVFDTKGLVIVDDDMNLISATFHSNCGGQTVNSEDVWSLSASYLRSVKDTFCLHMPNAHWQKTIATSDWINYLSLKQKYPVDDSLSCRQALTFPQYNGRELYFASKEFKIPLKTIRSDWQLKSTYFSIRQLGDSIVLNGRGYGHGVGLCQEGAMHMARLGISYGDIINFYYTGVHLVDLAVLNFLKED